jgi:hypothetical protein
MICEQLLLVKMLIWCLFTSGYVCNFIRIRIKIRKAERRREATILILFSHLVINHHVDNVMWSSGYNTEIYKGETELRILFKYVD